MRRQCPQSAQKQELMRYVIRWECEKCGTSGKISGEGKHEAWKKFEPVEDQDEHSNLFSRGVLETTRPKQARKLQAKLEKLRRLMKGDE